MGIKRRTPEETNAAIEAFGAAADTAPPTGGVAPASSSTPRSTAWPEDLPKSILLKFKDPEDVRLLRVLVEKLDRSQHDTALRAFRKGIEAMLAD